MDATYMDTTTPVFDMSPHDGLRYNCTMGCGFYLFDDFLFASELCCSCLWLSVLWCWRLRGATLISSCGLSACGSTAVFLEGWIGWRDKIGGMRWDIDMRWLTEMDLTGYIWVT